jgi:organic hydroperoxide reductase OsmC/OhrA
MEPFPHTYSVSAAGTHDGAVVLASGGLPVMHSSAPRQFGGPGTRWSPETLLVAAVADCFVLTFRAVAAASRLPWTSIDCVAVGTLERVDRVTRFTHMTLRARLFVADDVDRDVALRVLERTEAQCLITRSLNAEVAFEPEIELVADLRGMVGQPS